MADLAESVGSVDPGSVLRVEVPEALVPIISVPAPLPLAAGFAVATTNRASFRTVFTVTVGPSNAAGSFRVATLGRGLWDLYWTLGLSADYTTLGEVAAARIVDPGASVASFAFLFARVASQSITGRVPFLLPADDYYIDVAYPATAAAQNNVTALALVGNLHL